MQADAPTDADLMQAYARGDAAAFAMLYDRHERSVHRFIRRSLGTRFDSAADDVLQETWISVARAAARYVQQPAEARFATWLFTVARSRVVDHLRRQKVATVSLDDQGTQGRNDAAEGGSWADCLAADASCEPLARIESRRQAQAFIEALDELPDIQREAFMLQAEGGLSVEEIAVATGVGAETAKSRLRYARAKLRAMLAAWSPA